ncbi:MAG: bifunctional 5,10-methylenetetrahydrofolate dehydrogenase/5,10-methenyltetrahydrofolate cyclohydrolase [Gemmatimonadales bacterium]
MILDGLALARSRAPALAARGQRVAERLGRRPRLVLVAFADRQGEAAFVARKLRACAAAGVDVVPLVLPAETPSSEAEHALRTRLSREVVDAVFLEFPFPDGIDGDALTDLVPAADDVDIMTARRITEYFAAPDGLPPLTVSAGLELLDGHGVDIRGRAGVVVGPDIPFTRMFSEALARRGARMQPILPADDADLLQGVQQAALVVVAASDPGVVPSTALAAGSICIDVGYFNSGGRGDVDTSGGVAHLGAFSPVPGGIGPMTVSVLIERVIAFAEQAASVQPLE